jgi:hypothetical protein
MKLKKLLVLLLLLGSAFILTACAEQGLPGETGAQGDKGQTGDKGPTGAQGAAGADGVQIEFSFTSEGLAWRYVGTEEWTIGISFTDIFTVVNEYEVGPIIKAHGFDYVVDSSYAHLTAGAEQSVFGEALVFGETLFADLQSAFDAAKAASEVEGYEGLQIFVNKGQYEAATLEAAKVELFGPNVNANPNDENTVRVGEATVIEPLVIAADDVVINGLAVDLAGKIKLAEAGGVDNLTIKNVLFMSTSSYNSSVDGRVELMWAAGEAEDTYVAAEDYSNLVVENCRFEGNGSRLQNIYGMQLDGLTVKNNVFLGANAAVYDDCIKFYDCNTYSIKGEVLVEGNIFANVTQYSVWLLNYGPGNYVVKGNKFENCGLADTEWNRGTLTLNIPAESLFFSTTGEGDAAVTTPIEGAKAVVTYTNNEVISSSLGVRIGYAGLVEGQIEAKVNYNIFEQIAKTERIISHEDTNTFAAIDASNNYYDISVSADNFKGVTTWEPVIANRADALK